MKYQSAHMNQNKKKKKSEKIENIEVIDRDHEDQYHYKPSNFEDYHSEGDEEAYNLNQSF